MATMTTMPNQPREGRTSRGVRLDDEDWDDLGAVGELLDRDRGWIIRQLVRWYLGREGAALPERPGGKK
jgi:predicted transcriptional regulator